MLSLFLPRRSAAVTRQDFDVLSPFWYKPTSRQVASGADVNESSAMTYSACWAATRLLAGTASWLPLNLYRKVDDRREIQGKNRVHRLIHNQPNPEMTATSFRANQLDHQINWGNSYAEIQRQNGKPYWLWPIHPSRVQIKRDSETDDLLYEVANTGKEPTYIPAADMLHCPSILTTDGIVGKGVIQHARESIGFGLSTERHGANVFATGGVPRIVVTHPGNPNDGARREFRREWREIYGGPDGENVALLGGGMDVKQMQFSAEDNQYLATRQHNIEEIARWYGVPPHMIQQLLRATFSNIEHQGIEFVVYSLIPWLAIREQQIWAKLLDEQEQEEYYAKHVVTALLRGDATARAAFYTSMHNSGLMNRNEIRELEELNPVDGGEVFLVQGAMVPIDSDGIPIQPGANDTSSSSVPDTQDATPDGTNGNEDDTTAMRAELRVAACNMLSAALSKMLYKESQAMSRAAGSPTVFLKTVEEFYGKHVEQLANEILPAIQGLQATGEAPENLPAEWCAASQAALIEASGNERLSTLKPAIEKLVAGWSARVSVEVSKWLI